MQESLKPRRDTKIVRGPREERDPVSSAHRMPIFQTSTFVYENADEAAKAFQDMFSRFIYTRLGNPTINYLEEKLAYLEHTEAGAACASGMAAISTLLFAFVHPGEAVITSEPLYGGTHRFFKLAQDALKINFKYVKVREFNQHLPDYIDDKVKLVYTETPANPTLDIIDLEKVSKITKKHNIPLVVDNTFATPFHQRPIEFGADMVIHSLTKYLSGHGDTIGGVIVGAKDLIHKIKREVLFDYGGVISPFNAWLVLRGTKTLAVRMRKHSMNAMRIAEFLSSHPKVSQVLYPGLPSHPGHEIAKKQMENGFSGMVSFIVKGGKEAGKRVLNSVKFWTLAVSLGDTDSLIEHPASMTHSTYTPEELKAAGLDEGLIRLSVGIEDADDLIEDLDEALRVT